MKIKVSVKTNSNENKVIIQEEGLKVFLKKMPIDNKANEELVRTLKKYYKKNVKIIKGFKSKNKIIEVEDGD